MSTEHNDDNIKESVAAAATTNDNSIAATIDSSSSINGANNDEIIARHCHIIKRTDFDGYGFNLHSEKGKPGQYIGKVDSNSPALYAGLREGDRILQVNSVNIGSEAHKQVVQRIKALANEVRLLVVDKDVEVTKTNEIVNKFIIRESSSAINNNINNNNNNNTNKVDTTDINCDNNNVNNNISTPSSPSISIKSDSNKSDIINNINNNNNKINNHSTNNIMPQIQGNGSQSKHESPSSHQPPIAVAAMPAKIVAPLANDNNTIIAPTTTSQSQPQTSTVVEALAEESTATTATVAAVAVNDSSLNLKMTAAEMRARLKKKHDPKRDPVDMKLKYDLIQKM